MVTREKLAALAAEGRALASLPEPLGEAGGHVIPSIIFPAYIAEAKAQMAAMLAAAPEISAEAREAMRRRVGVLRVRRAS